MKLKEAVRQHQLALEAYRIDPDDEAVLYEYQNAKKELDILWLSQRLEK